MAGSHSRRAAGTPKRRWLRGVGASLLVLAMAPWLGLAAASAADPVYAKVTSHETNDPKFNDPTTWAKLYPGATCTKLGGTLDRTYVLTQDYVAVIVKAGSNQPGNDANTIFAAPKAGETVFADSNGDFTFNDGDKQISHIIFCTANPSPTTAVTPVRPSVVQAECVNGAASGASYTVVGTTGVVYKVGGTPVSGQNDVVVGSTPVTVVVTPYAASNGFRLTSSDSFTLTFAVPDCETTPTPIPVKAVSPTVTDAKCTDNGQSATLASYTILATLGVDYAVNGVVKPADTYTVGNGIGSVTVTAAAQAGYALNGMTSFPLTFKPATCVTPVAPVVVPVVPVAPVAPQVPVVAPVAPVAPQAPVVAPAPVEAPVLAPIVEGVKITNTTPVTAPTTAGGVETSPTPSETVLGVKVAATPSALGTLPRTGSEVMPLLAISGLLLLAGMTFMRLSGGRFQRTGKH